ncbi:hypothetical protein K0504_09630 [Neiella marina]|uniref:Uncharacterized protein n=1 Tax=Neiella holothuriorum TaxID=2870530 RepID=A0ABS7EG44_9GAMM|nr:hypothetical protein [Neiella holothuriorum]MBW8191296.1 hypothetical protein [Neiella holothuriorum]
MLSSKKLSLKVMLFSCSIAVAGALLFWLLSPIERSGPKVLVGQWMGGPSSCSHEYAVDDLIVFEFEVQQFAVGQSNMPQIFEQQRVEPTDVPVKILNYAERCSALDNPEKDWVRLTLKRRSGARVFYWVGQLPSNGLLPESATGGLLNDVDSPSLFVPYDASLVTAG